MLTRADTALLIVDVQEKLFNKMQDKDRLIEKLLILVKACDILNIPIILSEQYPQGLGPTVSELAKTISLLKNPISTFSKTHFSCFQDPLLQQHIIKQKKSNWIVAGIESHVCVMQTARDLHDYNLKVAVPADATSSRSAFDLSISWLEMRDAGIDVTSVESIVFELLVDAKDPSFKQISALLK